MKEKIITFLQILPAEEHRKSTMRMTFNSCLLLIILALVPSSVFAEKIMVLGDSLSAAYNIPLESGWVNLLRENLGEDYEIINASVSGETTGGGLARLPALLNDHQPSWVVIELGGNDGLRGYPIKLIKNNLENIIEITNSTGATPIVFGIRIPPNYGERYSHSFASIFPKIAEENNLSYLDFFDIEEFDAEDIATEKSLIQPDGIHPTESAQPLITEHVLSFLKPIFNKNH